MRFIALILTLAAAGFGGWVIGSFFPAPPALLAKINAPLTSQHVARELAVIDWKSLRNALSGQQLSTFLSEVMESGAASGQVVVVDRAPAGGDTDSTLYLASFSPASPGASGSGPVSAKTPTLKRVFKAVVLCPGMRVANAPATDKARTVRPFSPVVGVNGVPVTVNPTDNACLAGGFGTVGARRHRGLDYYSPSGGPVYAAANGVVLEAKYQDDYGIMVLIDHGAGVYTRYAHLAAFQEGLVVGAKVNAGEQIGLMGNTASYPLPIHLHYELLLGNYANPRSSFGLEAHDPFEYRA